MSLKNVINWRLLFILTRSSIFGAIAIMPFLMSTQEELWEELEVAWYIIFILQILIVSLICGLVIFWGLYFRKKVGNEHFPIPILTDWSHKKPLKNRLLQLLFNGFLGGFFIGIWYFLIDSGVRIIGDSFFESFRFPSIWRGFLAAYYGGIVEEILFRLFVMTFVVWIFYRKRKNENRHPLNIDMWKAIGISAFLYALMRLPVIATLDFSEIFQNLFMHCSAGIFLGWLYWKRGLETAMLAHFFSDMMLWVLFPWLI